MKRKYESLSTSSPTPFLNLPKQVVKNIGEYLEDSDLAKFSSSCRFFYSSLQENNQSLKRKIRENVKRAHCKKLIFNLPELGPSYSLSSQGLEIYRNLLIGHNWNFITAWNIKTGKVLWSFTENSFTRAKIGLANEKVIFMGIKRIDKSLAILIFNINTGTLEHTITHPGLHSLITVRVDNNQIIAILQNGEINTWDLLGQLVQNYKMASTTRPIDWILPHEKYIIDHHDKITRFTNRNNGHTIQIANKKETHAFYSGTLLYEIESNTFPPSITQMDMEQGGINEFKTVAISGSPAFDDTKRFKISSIVGTNRRLFIAYETSCPEFCSLVVVVDILNKTHQIMEQEIRPHRSLVLEGDFLFIHLIKTWDDQVLIIWDIRRMERVTSFTINQRINYMLVDNGAVFLSTNNSLVKYDFNRPRESIEHTETLENSERRNFLSM
jgi:hypothetical protein